MITYEGEQSLLEMLFQGDNIIVPAAGNFYLGLCNQTPDKNDTLADISTEPTVANGYARQAISRDVTGFPTIEQVNNETRVVSLVINFTAAGGAFDASFTRAFLCNVSAGSAGILLAYSGAYSSPILLADGQTQQVKFEFYP